MNALDFESNTKLFFLIVVLDFMANLGDGFGFGDFDNGDDSFNRSLSIKLDRETSIDFFKGHGLGLDDSGCAVRIVDSE